MIKVVICSSNLCEQRSEKSEQLRGGIGMDIERRWWGLW